MYATVRSLIRMIDPVTWSISLSDTRCAAAGRVKDDDRQSGGG